MDLQRTISQTLAEVGRRINNQFTIVEHLDYEVESTKAAVLNEQQRFQLWARSLGLYHRGHSSLDYRLRDSSFIFDYALGLLRDLEQTLYQFEKAPQNDSRQEYDSKSASSASVSHAWADYDDSSSERDSEEDLSSYQIEPLSNVLLANFVSTIDRLYRLAFKIRNPAIRAGSSRALNYTERDPETGVDLIEAYRISDLARFKDLLCSFRSLDLKYRPDDYLVHRLAKANSNRRRQFAYWKHRYARYEAQSSPESTEGTVSQPSMATRLNADNIDLCDEFSTISTNTSMTSFSEVGDHHVAIPKAPPIDPAAKEFKCPYCFTMLPSSIFQGKKWEVHIFRDLRPYICTFEDCRDPDQQYDSLHNWIVHENSKHILNENTDQQMYLKVSNAISKGQAGATTRNCIFCGKHNKSAVHVAWHLRRIALFALPRSTESESQDESPLSDHPLSSSSHDSGSEADAQNKDVAGERSSMINGFDNMSLGSKSIKITTSDSGAMHEKIGNREPPQHLTGDSAYSDDISEPSKLGSIEDISKYTPAAATEPEESSSSGSEPPEIRPLPRVEPQPVNLKCPTCSREFTKMYTLRSHMRVHQAIRPFSCDFCQKTFTRKNDCTRHRKIHLETRDWVCSGCQQAFSRSDVLNAHFQSQKGQACLQVIAQQEEI